MTVTFSAVIFYFLFAVIVITALIVVSAKNIVRSILSAVFTFLAVAGLYVLLFCDFLAAVQVLIYVGAITILIIFAVMLTHRIADRRLQQTNEQKVLAIIIGIVFLGILIFVFQQTVWHIQEYSAEPTTESIGKILFTTYLLPFEVVSVLLLAALIGAIIFTLREKERP